MSFFYQTSKFENKFKPISAAGATWASPVAPPGWLQADFMSLKSNIWSTSAAFSLPNAISRDLESTWSLPGVYLESTWSLPRLPGLHGVAWWLPGVYLKYNNFVIAYIFLYLFCYTTITILLYFSLLHVTSVYFMSHTQNRCSNSFIYKIESVDIMQLM